MRMTKVDDVCKHPFLSEDADDAADKGCYDLDEEHDPRWDFHVVSEFEVTGETDGLGGADVGDGFEDHVGDGTTGEHVTRDHLVENVERDLLVRDGLDHGQGDGEERGEEEGEEGAPDGELGREDFDCSEEQDEGDDSDGCVPPTRDFWVSEHETGVDVALVTKTSAEPACNVTTEPDWEGGVSGNNRKPKKRHSRKV